MNGRWILYLMLVISVGLLAFGISNLGNESTGELGTAFNSSIDLFWFFVIGFLMLIASIVLLIREFRRK